MKLFQSHTKKYLQGFTYKPTIVMSGFTLVEFIVIMAIFAVMVGVVLFNFTGFRSKVTLDNLAQDIALSVRNIQTSAGASISPGDNPENEIPRGIYFPYSPDLGTYDAKFITFQDNDRNGLYDAGEEIDTIVLQTPDRITDILYGSDLATLMTPIGSQSLGITFRRFTTGATFTDSSFSESVTNAGVIRIKVSSADRQLSRFITISKIGQVSVQNDSAVSQNP